MCIYCTVQQCLQVQRCWCSLLFTDDQKVTATVKNNVPSVQYSTQCTVWTIVCPSNGQDLFRGQKYLKISSGSVQCKKCYLNVTFLRKMKKLLLVLSSGQLFYSARHFWQPCPVPESFVYSVRHFWQPCPVPESFVYSVRHFKQPCPFPERFCTVR